MSFRRRRVAIQMLALLMALVFGAREVMARGGGGGGKTGGGSAKASKARSSGGGRGGSSGPKKSSSQKKVSREGPASGGLGTVKRAQEPQRPAAGSGKAASSPKATSAKTTPAKATSAKDQRQIAQAERQGSRGERREDAAANRDEAREDRQDHRDEAREDRQDFRDEAREDRQDFWDDRFDEGNWHDVDWNEVDWDEVEVWDDDDFEWGLGSWMAIGIGTALTVAAFDSMRSQPGCNFQQVIVEGTEYYHCGSTWYIQAYSGGDLRYMAVNPPAGF